ncbi:uncharacterized protein LOC135935284 [Cloeon dipterum]|uniref:uncharacterized protein LOC135935284 n=1 Tax=Cloeon dipterum TaxID=197152 RepID=UPI0032204EF7
MRLPSTYFFTLDCHQAAIIVAIFDLLWHLAMLFITKFLHVLMMSSDAVNADAKKLNETQHLTEAEKEINMVSIIEVFTIITICLMMYAVFSKKRWFMLPWFLVSILKIVIDFSLFYEVTGFIFNFSNEPYKALIWWTLLHLVIMGTAIYSFLAVSCSFNEIGRVNNGTASVDDSAVRFQAFDDSNVTGVV